MGNPAPFRFRLFVAGESANSKLAIANLNRICRDYLGGLHEIEIVDVLCEPKRGLAERVLLTPTLLKISPSPARKILGNLSDPRAVLLALGLEGPEP
jgi:circadian clock protein KaiB